MARSKTVIDAGILQEIIDKLESDNTYTKRGELFAAAALAYISRTGKKISAIMISTRFDELKLTCKTVKSSRGRPKKKTQDTPGEVSKVAKVKSMTRVEVAGPEADMDTDPESISI